MNEDLLKYGTFKYSDPDEMTDIAALEEEDLAIQSLHNGFLCTTDLY